VLDGVLRPLFGSNCDTRAQNTVAYVPRVGCVQPKENQGGTGAWVLRRAGPHTNNAGST